MKKHDVAVLVSGGLDSCILLKEMCKLYGKVYPVYVRCGLIWEKAELYWLKKFLKKTGFQNVEPLSILDVPVKELYGAHWSLTGKGTPDFHSSDPKVYLPGRNVIVLSKAAVFCVLHRIPNIALGILKSNPFLDSTRKFFSAFEKSIQKGLEFKLKILTPFSKMAKREVMKKAGGIPISLAFSCLKPKGIKFCGCCNKCAERRKVLK
jgi:7-cyano-7-deazaguanine synthase